MGAVNKTIGLEYVMLSNLEPSGFERMPGIHLKIVHKNSLLVYASLPKSMILITREKQRHALLLALLRTIL